MSDHPDFLAMTRRQVVTAMKEAGVVAPSTGDIDINLEDLAISAGYAPDEAARFSKYDK